MSGASWKKKGRSKKGQSIKQREHSDDKREGINEKKNNGKTELQKP